MCTNITKTEIKINKKLYRNIFFKEIKADKKENY